MKLAGWIIICFLVLLALLYSLSRNNPEKSFLLIVIDTLRADHVGCYGYPEPTTPHIDRLAKTSLQFSEVITQAPWTLPSVASILTGKLPSQHGAGFHDKRAVLASVPTIAENLKEMGYKTQAYVSIDNLLPEYGLNRGFDGYSFESRNAEQTCGKAFDWLKTNATNPFFLFLHFVDPHYPYAPPFIAMPVHDYARLKEKKDFFWPKNPGAEHKEDMVQLYDSEIRYVDYYLGKLFKYLKEKRLFERSVILLTSDHGEEFWDHGQTFHGNTMYDEQLLVPLIMAAPGPLIPAGVEYRQVSLVDVAPTVLSLAGCRESVQSEGTNLADHTRGPDSQYSYSENIWEGDEIKSLRAPDYKLMYYPDNGKFFLYNLEDDPREISGIPVNPDHESDKIKKLKEFSMTPSVPATRQLKLNEKTKERLEKLGYVQ